MGRLLGQRGSLTATHKKDAYPFQQEDAFAKGGYAVNRGPAAARVRRTRPLQVASN
jgi:hypothetical protein